MAMATLNRMRSAARRILVITAAAAVMLVVLTACTSNGQSTKQASGPARGETAYVLTAANTVIPVRLPQGVAGRPVKVPGDPVSLAVAHNGKTVYAISATESTPSGPTPPIPTNIDLSSFRVSRSGLFGPGLVTPINTGTGRAEQSIKVPGTPNTIIITPDDTTVYVLGIGDGGQGTLSVISTRTNTVIHNIPTGYNSTAMALTPNGSTLYVVGTGKSGAPADSGYALPISTSTDTPGRPVKVGATAGAITITGDGKTAFVVDAGGAQPSSITPIRLSDNTAEPAIRTGSSDEVFTAVVASTRGSTAYAITNRRALPIIGTPSRLGREIPAYEPPDEAIFSADGEMVYFAAEGETTYVLPFHVSTSKFKQPIPIGHDARGMALSRDGSTLYILDSDVSSIIPVSTSTDKIGQPITLTDAPHLMVIG